jgi:DNA-binding MarR family transcriptional regulator
VLLLGRLERLNEAFVTETCQRNGVTPAELRVLAMLRHARTPAGVRPSLVARAIVQTTGGLTATLGRLEAAGRVIRTDDPDDARSRLVTLTDAGRAFHDDVFADLTDRFSMVMAHVDIGAALAAVRELLDGYERIGNHISSTALELGIHNEGASA